MRQGRVRNSAISDVMKVWAWALGSLLVALWLTPVAYNGGKALAELSLSKDFNGLVNKSAGWSGAAELKDFFEICWFFAALVLLFPLIEWLRLGNGRAGKNPWQIRLPHGAGASVSAGQPMAGNSSKLLQGLAGFLLTFGCFTLIGVALVRAGTFTVIGNAKGWSQGLWWNIAMAVLVALLVEMFFRRVLLGVFLRAMQTTLGIALAALMFAGVLFILSGFAGVAGVDGETLSVFHLAEILFSGKNLLERIVVVFVPCFAFGFVLGWARWRTASMWLPTGLLTGWLLADQLFSKMTQAVPVNDKVVAFFAADSVHNGIIPLLGVIAVGGFVHVSTHGISFPKNDSACD